jgi:hypothetical protein
VTLTDRRRCLAIENHGPAEKEKKTDEKRTPLSYPLGTNAVVPTATLAAACGHDGRHTFIDVLESEQ